MSKPTEIKKMGAKTIMEKARGVRDADNGALFSVLGKCINYKTGQAMHGDFVAFKGRFEAKRTHDGKIFTSSTLFLPELPTEILVNALTSRKDDKKGLDFMYEISKVEDDTSATGYIYEHKELLSAEVEIDALEEVKNKMLLLEKKKEDAVKTEKKKSKDK